MDLGGEPVRPPKMFPTVLPTPFSVLPKSPWALAPLIPTSRTTIATRRCIGDRGGSLATLSTAPALSHHVVKGSRCSSSAFALWILNSEFMRRSWVCVNEMDLTSAISKYTSDDVIAACLKFLMSHVTQFRI